MTSPQPSGPYSLRPVGAADADAVLAAFTSHPDMARQGEVETIEQARTYVDWLRGEQRRAVAVTDSSGSMIGLVALSIDQDNRAGWFFYWMHAQHRGRGLIGRAAATVADRALAPLEQGGWGLDRLELGHRANNPASGAVARAAGFVQEGVERQKFLIDGERHDVLAYGRLRTDRAPSTPHLPWAPQGQEMAPSHYPGGHDDHPRS
ncbi:GNAT family N-acetyltransferase [Brachybacterium sp. p3-SID957]|uniref:GNAT family N-acetyltransferase n=1 Tax=Brachybacterium sp. p3-SID957 TaxID=2916049 RepID=UPI00223BC305|nr:GNAT family protein [Brachybacterium sp. p3-SID957]MCT1776788.1 GNAT family N-acetyltransferase [Brachybacterium sp. p3-SID957]